MRRAFLCCVALWFLAVAAWAALAAEPADPPHTAPASATEPTPEAPPPKAIAPDAPKAAAPEAAPPAAEATPPLVRLSPTSQIWLDTRRKAVVVDGQVCLREGPLEMFACPKGSKEHESVVSLNCASHEVHAALLAVGARPGRPVQFQPQYQPASGQVIDIYVLWKDARGEKHQVRAQEWVRHTRTGQALEFDWVFAGSGFWKDEQTGKEYYKADGGDLVCVSNFPSATLDLPVESSQANAELLFEAFTERIPPRGTKVRLVLLPRAERPQTLPAPDAKSENDTKPETDTQSATDANRKPEAPRETDAAP